MGYFGHAGGDFLVSYEVIIRLAGDRAWRGSVLEATLPADYLLPLQGVCECCYVVGVGRSLRQSAQASLEEIAQARKTKLKSRFDDSAIV